MEDLSRAPLDTARPIATPEGIELTLRLAGPVPRALAWSVDFAVRGAILIAIGIIAGALQKFGAAIMLLSAFFLEWLYPAWFEVAWGGATPGKRALGIMVLNDDGTPVRWPAALTRNLLRTVDFLPLLYFTGFAAMAMNRDFKRLGDLAADTLVIYRESAPKAMKIPEAEPIAPRAALTVAEQRAVLDFAERSPGLTPERAQELAEIAASLTGQRSGQRAVSHLIGVANYLVGRG
jgi:uncharacterized RDD family membrane protein YckC